MKNLSIFSKMGKAIVVFASALVFSAFMIGDDNNAQRFKNAALDLDKTSHTLVDEYDYWPECGIRVTGSHLASLISLNELQKMLPCPLYVSGPHHDGQWDLDNEEDFGHYNPEAIQYLANLAQKVVADKKFVELSKSLIDRYLYRQMHIMMVIHDALYDGTYSQEEREGIFNTSVETKGLEYDDYDVGFYLNRLKLDDDSYVFSNISYRFLHFWARRWVDGTIDPFYQGLSTIFMAYYPEYEYSAERYLIPYEEWFEEGGYEEEGHRRLGATLAVRTIDECRHLQMGRWQQPPSQSRRKVLISRRRWRLLPDRLPRPCALGVEEVYAFGVKSRHKNEKSVRFE